MFFGDIGVKKIFVYLKLGVLFLAISAVCAKFVKAGLYSAESKLNMFVSGEENNGNNENNNSGNNSSNNGGVQGNNPGQQPGGWSPY